MKKFILLCISFCMVFSISCAATFSDLEDSWAKADIEKAVELGLVSGYPDGTFKPSNNITRIEFMVVMNKILEQYSSIGDLEFKDVYMYSDINEASWAIESYLSFMVRADLYGNKSNSDFGKEELMNIFGAKLEPSKPITREEAVALLSHFIKDEAKVGLPDSFSDIGSATFPESIKLANKIGITSGYPDGTFKPFNKITRAEATKMLLTFYDISYYFKNINLTSVTDTYNTYLEPADVMKKILWYESAYEYNDALVYYNPNEIADLRITYIDYMKNPFIHAYNGTYIATNNFEITENRISDSESVVFYKHKYNDYTFSKKFTNINGKWYASLQTDISL